MERAYGLIFGQRVEPDLKKGQGRGDDFGRANDFCGWIFDPEVILDLEFLASVFGVWRRDCGFSGIFHPRREYATG